MKLFISFCARFIGCLILISISYSCVYADSIVTLQHRNKDKQRTFKLKGTQYLLLLTKEEEYRVQEIVNVSDSLIHAIEWGSEDPVSIPLEQVLVIKKMRVTSIATGYLILGMSAVGMAIGVPARWIKDGPEAVGNQVLGTLAIASISVPLIYIGKWTTRFNGRKWKLASA